MRIPISLLLLLLLPGSLLGSPIPSRSYTDSLKTQLRQESGQARVQTLLQLADCYYHIQLDSASAYAQRARNEARRLSDFRGFHRARYHQLRIDYHNLPVASVKPKVRAVADWFEKHGHRADRLACDLLYLDCLKTESPFEEIATFADALLPELLELNDPQLLGEYWYRYHLAKASQLTGSKYKQSLDSAEACFLRAGDSLGLLQVVLRRADYRIGKANTFDIARMAQSKARRWGCKALEARACGIQSLNFVQYHVLDSLTHYAEQHLALAHQYGSRRNLASAQFYFGYVLADDSHPQQAIAPYLTAIKAYRDLGDLHETYNTNKALGSVYLSIDAYDLAIDCYMEAFALAKQLQHAYFIARTQVSLAQTYGLTKDLEKSKSMYQGAIEVAQTQLEGSLKNKSLGYMYEGLGRIYRLEGNFPKALHYLNLSLGYWKGTNRSRTILVTAKTMSLYLDLDDFANAEQTWDSLIGLQKTTARNLRSSFPIVSLQEGRLLFKKKKWPQAIQALDVFLKHATPAKTKQERLLAHQLLHTAHEQLSHYAKALEHHKAFKALNDSIVDANAVENLAHAQRKYELSAKEAALNEIKQEQALQALTLEKRDREVELGRLYILLLGAALLVIGLLSFWMYQRLRIRKAREVIKANADKLALEKANLEAARQVELAKAKDELFANVSHEFRTPLTLIHTPLKGLMERATPEQLPTYRSMLRNTDHLMAMVDEVLELSRLESGTARLHRTEIDLEAFLAGIKLDFHPLFQRKQIGFSVDIKLENPTLNADRNQLKVLLNNLLKNAWHHCPEKGRVALVVEAAGERRNNELSIQVTNTRKSAHRIDPKQLFNRHYRGQSESYPGSGLGLAICKEIATLHGGTIGVKTLREYQVEFEVRLPVNVESTSSIPATEESTAPGQNQRFCATLEPVRSEKPTVLVVEDNREMQQLLNTLLSDQFDLRFADDGEAGEQAAREHQPDLVLSDVMMPRKDGFELLQALKENVDTSHIPVLLLTARADRESRIGGWHRNADGYLSKPFDARELVAHIHNLLRQRERLHQLFRDNPFAASKNLTVSALDRQFLDKARTLVEDNYHLGNYTVARFCQDLALNRTSVHNKLKALTDQSASQFIQTIRLTKATEQLLQSTSTVDQVALDCGFNSRQAFYQAFRKKHGTTPADFRKQKAV